MIQPASLAPHVVIHVPHASTVIPPEMREPIVLTDAQLAREVRLMTDHLTDQLFEVPGVPAIRFPVSRLAVDPERFEDDSEERMAAHGLGVVYTHTADGRTLRRPLAPGEREALLDRWYRPHHERLGHAVDRALEANGACLVVDAHSFPAHPLPYEVHQSADRPDICIGTDDFHTSAALRDLAVAACREQGWSVDVNRPFDGALVPRRHYGSDKRVAAIMIEVNRALYLNSDGATASQGFGDCRARLRVVLDRLIAVGLRCGSA